ncbi:GNAT family N-acetyltransferase [Gorillibacterium sp. CAU 1737]|uniref:GNAT family N-acetyltransferase n=1 Tax=Gorillibacterium sp. CAU 1737 TaxID=3140362 RepID=UPI003261948B
MIVQLNKGDFDKIKPLTDACMNLEVKAVVGGQHPGEVYVDDSEKPTAALIWIPGQQGFQLVGDENSQSFRVELDDYMRTAIEPRLAKLSVGAVEIGGDKETWGKALPSIFPSRSVSSDLQHVLRFKHRSPFEFHEEGIAIHRIDRELWKSRRLENHSFLEKKIHRFWETTDAFLDQGYGYYAESDNQLVSLCFSAFVAGNTHAIDIETLEGFRKRALGTAVASRYVEEAIQRGLAPYWDCTPSNTGSLRIAKAVGMEHDFDYTICWFDREGDHEEAQ